jgi:hypothetical protein
MKLARYGQRAGDRQTDLGIVVNLNLNLLVLKTSAFLIRVYSIRPAGTHGYECRVADIPKRVGCLEDNLYRSAAEVESAR